MTILVSAKMHQIPSMFFKIFARVTTPDPHFVLWPSIGLSFHFYLLSAATAGNKIRCWSHSSTLRLICWFQQKNLPDSAPEIVHSPSARGRGNVPRPSLHRWRRTSTVPDWTVGVCQWMAMRSSLESAPPGGSNQCWWTQWGRCCSWMHRSASVSELQFAGQNKQTKKASIEADIRRHASQITRQYRQPIALRHAWTFHRAPTLA